MIERPDAPALHAHAMENLRYIRDTMERAGAFTAVPGTGGMLMGATAVAAAALSGPPDGSARWLAIWLADGAIAAAIGLATMMGKAKRSGSPLSAAPALRFGLAFLAPLVAGAALTVVFARYDLATRLPGCWLLLYGAAVATGGALSVRVVPVTGLFFMTFGIMAFLTPAAWGHFWMAAGFGGLHLVFGFVIRKDYGG